MVHADKSFDLESSHENHLVVFRASPLTFLDILIVLGDGSAEGNSTSPVHGLEDRVESVSTNVVKVAVNAVRAGSFETFLDRFILVIDHLVKSELLS